VSLDAIDTVLKRNRPCLGTYQSARLLACSFRIPQLYGEQHDVDRSDLFRIIRYLDVLQIKVAQGALYLEAVPANSVAVRAARDKRHIVPSCGHPPAEITSDSPRRHDRDPHVASSCEAYQN
jgi:hypothetical protein